MQFYVQHRWGVGMGGGGWRGNQCGMMWCSSKEFKSGEGGEISYQEKSCCTAQTLELQSRQENEVPPPGTAVSHDGIFPSGSHIHKFVLSKWNHHGLFSRGLVEMTGDEQRSWIIKNKLDLVVGKLYWMVSLSVSYHSWFYTKMQNVGCATPSGLE